MLVCHSGGRAHAAGTALAEVGLAGVGILENGMRGWQAAGGTVTQGRQAWDIERQVRFVAGSIVTASIVGSLAAPRLKWLAAGVGSGLVGAALTNSCAMSNLLARLPWNRAGNDPDIREVSQALAAAA